MFCYYVKELYMKRNKCISIFTIALLLAVMVLPLTAIPAAAADAWLDSYSGHVGEDIDISGEDFKPYSYVTIYFDDEEIEEYRIDSDGEFWESFEVPELPADTYEIRIKGTDAEDSTWTESFDFEVTPEVTVSSTKVQVGETIEVSGTGFGYREEVTIYLDDYDDYEVTEDTNSSGTFDDVSFTVPEAPAGSHDLIVDDGDNEDEISITIEPKIEVSDTDVSIGDTIIVSGTGFEASSDITFYFDDEELEETAETNSYGTIPDTEIVIPPVLSGEHTLEVIDEDDNSVEVDITTIQSISISPKSGPGDTLIEITGQGFDTDETVNITMNDLSIKTVESDSYGRFETEFNALKLPAGTYEIEASDGLNTTSADFTIVSSADLSQDSGIVADSIDVSGSGFKTNFTVTIKFDSANIAAASTNSDGEFSAAFTIPPTTAGNHAIVITDGSNSVTIPFTVEPGVMLNPATGHIGQSITIKGYAYAPSAPVTIKYDSSQVATATTDTTGSFEATFKVPSVKSGSHTITVSDGSTATESTFNVETQAPPVPELIKPIELEKAKSLAVLEWEDVSDPSGVNYRVQVAENEDFSSILVDEYGISESTYTLTEKLPMAGKKTPYYWRVKAIDGAANESAWSAPQTFTVGLPVWAIVLIAVGGVLVVLGGILFYTKVINRRFGY
jgi:hypothetical protein